MAFLLDNNDSNDHSDFQFSFANPQESNTSNDGGFIFDTFFGAKDDSEADNNNDVLQALCAKPGDRKKEYVGMGIQHEGFAVPPLPPTKLKALPTSAKLKRPVADNDLAPAAKKRASHESSLSSAQSQPSTQTVNVSETGDKRQDSGDKGDERMSINRTGALSQKPNQERLPPAPSASAPGFLSRILSHEDFEPLSEKLNGMGEAAINGKLVQQMALTMETLFKCEASHKDRLAAKLSLAKEAALSKVGALYETASLNLDSFNAHHKRSIGTKLADLAAILEDIKTNQEELVKFKALLNCLNTDMQ